MGYAVIAKAGEEYSTTAPSEVRILARAKTCGVVTDENEGRVQAIAAAIIRMEKTSLCAAIAEAIQYEQPGAERTFDEWANSAMIDVPAMRKDYSNLREVRESGRVNAISARCRSIKQHLTS